MRFASKVDANQPAIVKALRGIGASVQSLAMVGQGVPDLLVWFRPEGAKVGRYTLLELKDPAQPAANRKLKPTQVKWHAAWNGPVSIVETVDEAIAAVTQEPA